MVVPVAAILPGEEGGTAVLVVSADSVAHLRKVDLGVREGDKVQLLTGVLARRGRGDGGRHGRGRQGQGQNAPTAPEEKDDDAMSGLADRRRPPGHPS